MDKHQSTNVNIRKALLLTAGAYILLVFLFYWLAGDQLHYRASRGNLEQPVAEAGTVELTQGAVVEQAFQMKIQRLQSVSVQWGTYYRPNAGTVTMELLNLLDGTVVMAQTFDAASIAEGGLTTMSVETPIENAVLCSAAVAALFRFATRQRGISLNVGLRP